MCRAYETCYRLCSHRSKPRIYRCDQHQTYECDDIYQKTAFTLSFCDGCWYDELLREPEPAISRNFELSLRHAPIIRRLPADLEEQAHAIWNRARAKRFELSLTTKLFEGLTAPKDIEWCEETLNILHQDLVYRLYTRDRVSRPNLDEITLIFRLRRAVDKAEIGKCESRIEENQVRRWNILFAKVSLSDLQEGERECVICQEGYVCEKPIRARRCGHVFGENCLKSWVSEGDERGCPYCRRRFESVMELDAEELGEENLLWWLDILKGRR